MDATNSSNDTGRRLLRNSAILMTSQVFSWALASVQAVVLPRYFGPEVAGQFHIGLSLWAIVTVFIAFGTDMTISRRVARGEGDLGELLGSAMAPRLALHLVGAGFLTLYTILLDYSPEVLSVVLVFSISNLFVAASSVYGSALYGIEEMRAISVAAVGAKLITTIGIVVLLLLGASFESVLLTFVPAGLLLLGLQWRALQKARPHRLKPNLAVARGLYAESVQIFSNRVARNLYVQLDVVVVSWLVTETVVGYYSAADILFGSLLFIPTVFGTALMPAIARTFADDPAASLAMTRRSVHLLLVAVMPIGFGVIAVAQPFIELVYGADFAEAGPVLAIFGPVIILTSINTLLGQQLFAMNEERRLTQLTVVALMVAIPADLALIYWTQQRWENGAIGAGLAYVITEGVIVVGSVRMLPRLTLDRQTLWLATRAVAAGCLMVLATIPVRGLHVIVMMLVGAGTYAVLTVAFRLVSVADRQLLLSAFRRGSSSGVAG